MLIQLRVILIICILAFTQLAFGQDSLKVFTLKDLYGVMANTHPVVRQANLLTEAAQQELRIARGNFDPKINSSLYRKEYGGKTYYNQWDSYLSVPVWFGTDLKVGYEKNHGARLNPEDYTSSAGLAYAGISIPVGQGLFTDGRRTDLRNAQLFQQIADADRIKLINKVTLDAAKDYWDWFYAFQQLRYIQEGYQLAEQRFRAVTQRVIYGDLAPIDSVEAQIIYQDRAVQLRQAELDVKNARIQLSNYLWGEDMVPMELEDNVIPDTTFTLFSQLDRASLGQMLEIASANHPDLIKINTKIEQLNNDRRLYTEMLKPVINLNYNLLNAPPVAENNLDYAFMSNNYKLGVQFIFPLFLRKERGKLQLTKAKIMSTNYELMQRNREIANNIQATYNELMNMEAILFTQTQMVENYQLLSRSEVMRFEEGESSLFLINTRETKLIEAQIKLASLQAKYLKAKATLIWAAGASEWNK